MIVVIRKMPLLVTRASPSNESVALAKLYCTLSSKYSIAKLRSFDNGTSAIFINFYGLLLIPKIRFFFVPWVFTYSLDLL